MDNETKDMKVLFVSNYYYPHWTGIVQYAKTLGEGLVKSGFKVKVWTIQNEKSLKKHETVNGVEVNRSTAWWRISRTWLSPNFIWGMGRQIKNSDQVVVFLPMAEVLEAVIWAKIFRKKIYLVYNGDLKLTSGILNKVIEFIFLVTTDMAIKMCTRIIVNTSDYAKSSKLLKNNRSKWIEIIPPFNKFKVNRISMREIKKNIGPAKFVVGFGGRFVEEKGFDILLKAIPRVVKLSPGTKFLFAGETNIQYENTFHKNIKEWSNLAKHIIVLGKLHHDQMGSFYRNCNLFVISSRSDFFPFTQAEALISGVPVVTTDIPGARWPVKVTRAGKIVSNEDPEKLAEGIVDVLRHEEKYKEVYSDVEKYFDYNRTMEKYISLLRGTND